MNLKHPRSEPPIRAYAPLLLFAAPLLAISACADLLGYEDYTTPQSASSSGAGGVDSGSGSTLCAPGSTRPCFSDRPATQDADVCRAGVEVCDKEGAFGECVVQGTPTFERCSTPNIDENCDGIATCTGNYGWASRFGSDEGEQLGNAVAVDAAGNVFVVGKVAGTVDFDGEMSTPVSMTAASDEIFVLKLDPKAGKRIWVRRFGGDATQSANGVALDSEGNVFVVGQVAGTVKFDTQTTIPSMDSMGPPNDDIFALKLDPTAGKVLWVKRFGDGAKQIANGVAVDQHGSAVITGSFEGKVVFNLADMVTGTLTSQGARDGFVVRLASGGAPLWARPFSGAPSETGDQIGRAVAIDPLTLDPIVVGQFTGPLTIPKACSTKGNNDVFVARLSEATKGTLLWIQCFGSTAHDIGRNVAIDDAGSALISGSYEGSCTLGVTKPITLETHGTGNIFLARLALSNGEFIFARGFGDAQGLSGHGLAVDPEGNVVLAAAAKGAIDFGGGPLENTGGYDAFVTKLDPEGGHLWSKRFGDATGQPTDQSFSGVAINRQGGVVLTGGSTGPVDYGGGALGPMQSTGKNNITVVELAP